MNFKIDTREKFTMITPNPDFSSDNLTAELKELVASLLQHKTNIVMNLHNVAHVEENVINQIAALQQQFYEANVSFVLCGLQPQVQALVNEMEFDDVLNITPTETEAWDIVQMEEIERELLSGE